MLVRTALLTGALLVALAPSASAAVSDTALPPHEGEGLRITPHGRHVDLRVGPGAARLYRRELAGRRVTAACGLLDDDDEAGVRTSDAPVRAPRRRSRFLVHLAGNADVCTLNTRRRESDGSCMEGQGTPNTCVRLAVALTDAGRARFDEVARTFDLIIGVGVVALRGPDGIRPGLADDVVELESPDGTPPPGKLGYWRSAGGFGAVVLLADGRRWFARYDGDVYSTNVESLGLFGSRDLPTFM